MSPTVTFAHLQSRSLIALGGPDWRNFLQNLITQDIEAPDAATARFGALLTPQGRLLYDLFVVERPDGTAWLDVEAEHRDALILRLTMYRLRAKVEIAADDTKVAVLFGADGAPSRPDDSRWVADGRLPELGWRGYGVDIPADAAPATEDQREAQKRRLGVPGPKDWGVDRTYPIEANFDLLGGIDFHKGCFIGQETTSRMKRRGVIKNRMLPIVYDGPAPAFGSEVLVGDLRAGEMLAGADGQGIALVRLDRALGAALSVDGRAARVEVPSWMAEAVAEPAG